VQHQPGDCQSLHAQPSCLHSPAACTATFSCQAAGQPSTIVCYSFLAALICSLCYMALDAPRLLLPCYCCCCCSYSTVQQQRMHGHLGNGWPFRGAANRNRVQRSSAAAPAHGSRFAGAAERDRSKAEGWSWGVVKTAQLEREAGRGAALAPRLPRSCCMLPWCLLPARTEGTPPGGGCPVSQRLLGRRRAHAWGRHPRRGHARPANRNCRVNVAAFRGQHLGQQERNRQPQASNQQPTISFANAAGTVWPNRPPAPDLMLFWHIAAVLASSCLLPGRTGAHRKPGGGGPPMKGGRMPGGGMPGGGMPGGGMPGLQAVGGSTEARSEG